MPAAHPADCRAERHRLCGQRVPRAADAGAAPAAGGRQRELVPRQTVPAAALQQPFQSAQGRHHPPVHQPGQHPSGRRGQPVLAGLFPLRDAHRGEPAAGLRLRRSGAVPAGRMERGLDRCLLHRRSNLPGTDRHHPAGRASPPAEGHPVPCPAAGREH